MLVSEIRQAGAEDIDFLIEAIIEAEKSGSEMISYCGIFGLSQAELIELMRKMLAEDLEGQQLCISGFAIACVCCWGLPACSPICRQSIFQPPALQGFWR